MKLEIFKFWIYVSDKPSKPLKQGKRVTRKGWNGKGMFLYLVKGTLVDKEFLRNEAAFQPTEDKTGVVTFLSHIDMFTAQKLLMSVGLLLKQIC